MTNLLTQLEETLKRLGRTTYDGSVAQYSGLKKDATATTRALIAAYKALQKIELATVFTEEAHEHIVIARQAQADVQKIMEGL